MLRHAFRLSDSEALRDEALNLMACAHWQLGNDEEAQQALTAAIEGSRNPSLQVNLGVVAAGLDPEVAALELARLVNEAQSLELRTVAAMKAVSKQVSDVVSSQTALATGEVDILVGGGEWITAALSGEKPNLDWTVPDQGAVRCAQSIGVMKAFEAASMTATTNGMGDTPSASAAATAIGVRTTAAALLLITSVSSEVIR